MSEDDLKQLWAMSRRAHSEGTSHSDFHDLFDSYLERFKSEGSKFPENIQETRAQVETWRHFWPNEIYLANITFEETTFSCAGCEVQDQTELSTEDVSAPPNGLTLAHDAPVYLAGLLPPGVTHTRLVRSQSAGPKFPSLLARSGINLSPVDPAPALSTGQHSLQGEPTPLVTQESLQIEQPLLAPNIETVALQPESPKHITVRLPPLVQHLGESLNPPVPLDSELTPAKFISELDGYNHNAPKKFDRVANTKKFDRAANTKKPSPKNAPHWNDQNPPALPNVWKPKGICGNCIRGDHVLRDCVAPVDEYGFILGCPLCNKNDHLMEACKYLSESPMDAFNYYCIKARNNRPPIRCTFDFRNLPGFWESLDRPWTCKFSLQQAGKFDIIYNTNGKSQNPIRDPAWENTKFVGSQAEHIDAMTEITVKVLSLFPDGRAAFFLHELQYFRKILQKESLLMGEKFKLFIQSLDSVNLFPKKKREIGCHIIRSVGGLLRLADLETKGKTKINASKLFQGIDTKEKGAQIAEFEAYIVAYHESSEAENAKVNGDDAGPETSYSECGKGLSNTTVARNFSNNENYPSSPNMNSNDLKGMSIYRNRFPPSHRPKISVPNTPNPSISVLSMPHGTVESPYRPQSRQLMGYYQQRSDPATVMGNRRRSFQGMIAKSRFRADLTPHIENLNLKDLKSPIKDTYTGFPNSRVSSHVKIRTEPESGKEAQTESKSEKEAQTRHGSEKEVRNKNECGKSDRRQDISLLAIPQWQVAETKEQKAVRNKIRKLNRQLDEIERLEARRDVLSHADSRKVNKKCEKQAELAALSNNRPVEPVPRKSDPGDNHGKQPPANVSIFQRQSPFLDPSTKQTSPESIRENRHKKAPVNFSILQRKSPSLVPSTDQASPESVDRTPLPYKPVFSTGLELRWRASDTVPDDDIAISPKSILSNTAEWGHQSSTTIKKVATSSSWGPSMSESLYNPGQMDTFSHNSKAISFELDRTQEKDLNTISGFISPGLGNEVEEVKQCVSLSVSVLRNLSSGILPARHLRGTTRRSSSAPPKSENPHRQEKLTRTIRRNKRNKRRVSSFSNSKGFNELMETVPEDPPQPLPPLLLPHAGNFLLSDDEFDEKPISECDLVLESPDTFEFDDNSIPEGDLALKLPDEFELDNSSDSSVDKSADDSGDDQASQHSSSSESSDVDSAGLGIGRNSVAKEREATPASSTSGKDTGTQASTPNRITGNSSGQSANYKNEVKSMLELPNHPAQKGRFWAFPIRPGDWICQTEGCGRYNHKEQVKCSRCYVSCGSFSSVIVAFLGDWNCTTCHYLNFGEHKHCFDCGAHRKLATLYLSSSLWGCKCGQMNSSMASTCSQCQLGCDTGCRGRYAGLSPIWKCSCNHVNFANVSNCPKCDSHYIPYVIANEIGDWKCISEGCGIYNSVLCSNCDDCDASCEGAPLVINAATHPAPPVKDYQIGGALESHTMSIISRGREFDESRKKSCDACQTSLIPRS